MTRIDIHRPSTIQPRDYEFVLAYAMPTTDQGVPVPAYNLDVVIALHKSQPFATTTPGKCTVCGARYVDGQVWRHEPTGEHIHIGHDCARKYDLLANLSTHELALKRHRAAARAAGARASADAAFGVFVAANGLDGVFEVDHHIIADLASRARRFGSLSEKQIALARKIADEIRNPAPKNEPAYVPAPEGKVEFEGEVVSTRVDDTAYGSVCKMLVVVETPAGIYKVWSTIPSGIFDTVLQVKGSRVRVTATLQRGKDAHFAIAKRPRGVCVRPGSPAR